MLPLPILMQLLQGAASSASSAIKAIPEIIPSDYEKENKQRLGTLKDLMDSGQLGLTDAEKARIYEAQSAGLERQLVQAKAAQDQLAAQAAGSGAGNELRTATALGAEAAKSRQAINRDVEMLNQKRKADMEQEMWARQLSDSEAKKRRQAAVTNVAAAGLDTLAGANAVNRTVAPTATKADYSKQMTEQLKTTYGLSDETAALLAAQGINNPDLLSALDKLLK